MPTKKPDGTLFVVSAPSGAGKTTLCSRIFEAVDSIASSVSHTTRKPRKGERDGKDYYFVDEPAFRTMVRRGEFVEWAEVHGNLYGTSKRQLSGILASGRDVLLDIDTQGARQIWEQFENSVLVFILPPSMTELRRRLEGRMTNTAEDRKRRLRNAAREIGEYKMYNYVIVNDDLLRSVQQLEAIITAERLRAGRKTPAWIRENILRR